MDHADLRVVQRKLHDALCSALEALARCESQQERTGSAYAEVAATLREVLLALEGCELHDGLLLIEALIGAAEAVQRKPALKLPVLRVALQQGVAAVRDAVAQEPHAALSKWLPIALVNDLRVLTGAPLLSENPLFEVNLDAKVSAPQPRAMTEEQTTALIASLRHHYQQGLVDWLRQRAPRAGIARLEVVLKRLVVLCAGRSMGALWWAALAVVEGISDQGVDDCVTVRRLIARIDAELKHFARGTPLTEAAVPESLVKSLLFYVESSRSPGRASSVVRRAFALGAVFDVTRVRHAGRGGAAAGAVGERLRFAAVLLGEATAVPADATRACAEATRVLLSASDSLALLGRGSARRRLREQLDALAAPALGAAQIAGIAKRLEIIAQALSAPAADEPCAAPDHSTAPAPSEPQTAGVLEREFSASLHHAQQVLGRLDRERSEPALPTATAEPALDIDAIHASVQDRTEVDGLGLAAEPDAGADIEALARRTAALSGAHGPGGDARETGGAKSRTVVSRSAGAEREQLGGSIGGSPEQGLSALRDGLLHMNDTIRKLRGEAHHIAGARAGRPASTGAGEDAAEADDADGVGDSSHELRERQVELAPPRDGEGTPLLATEVDDRELCHILTVEAGGETLGVPSEHVRRIVRLTEAQIDAARESAKIEIDGTSYLIARLSVLLGFAAAERVRGHVQPVLLLDNNCPPIALLVDAVNGQRAAPLSVLGPQFAAIPGLRGAAVEGEEAPVLILDMPALVASHLQHSGDTRQKY